MVNVNVTLEIMKSVGIKKLKKSNNSSTPKVTELK